MFTPHATLQKINTVLLETILLVIVATVYGERFSVLPGSA